MFCTAYSLSIGVCTLGILSEKRDFFPLFNDISRFPGREKCPLIRELATVKYIAACAGKSEYETERDRERRNGVCLKEERGKEGDVCTRKMRRARKKERARIFSSGFPCSLTLSLFLRYVKAREATCTQGERGHSRGLIHIRSAYTICTVFSVEREFVRPAFPL